jgi:gas vesicle protein
MKNTGLFLGGLFAGAAIGASVALLYAPQKGTETREQVKAKMKDLEKELQHMREKMKEKGGEIKDELKKKMNDIEKKIEQLIGEYKKTMETAPNAN